jgi:rhamnogalacturonyl hydrolase YesR
MGQYRIELKRLNYGKVHRMMLNSYSNTIFRADFIYMAPPFLAYYALHTSNLTLLEESVEQCTLYRQVLQMPGDNGVWEHIVGPPSPDPGLWSTGNGWAAAGMTRILAALTNSPNSVFGKDGQKEYDQWRSGAMDTLTGYITEIVDGAMASPMDDNLLRNYLDDISGDGHGFGEVSGSTLLASVVYRMAVLQPKTFAKKGSNYLDWADGILKTLGSGGHIMDNGTATPTVNPLDWFDTTPSTTGSPEGQNFVVLMYVAWRDCVGAGIC